MVPMAPSATRARRESCSRNCWARVEVAVLMCSPVAMAEAGGTYNNSDSSAFWLVLTLSDKQLSNGCIMWANQAQLDWGASAVWGQIQGGFSCEVFGSP